MKGETHAASSVFHHDVDGERLFAADEDPGPEQRTRR